MELWYSVPKSIVSIHAPAGGATQQGRSSPSHRMFQSTRLREARQGTAPTHRFA